MTDPALMRIDRGRWTGSNRDEAGPAKTITLTLHTDAATPAPVAFWSTPTVSGSARPSKPNVILYETRDNR